MVKCSITNGTVDEIRARDILNNKTYPDYETCYDKLTLDELKEIVKIVFDKKSNTTTDRTKIGNHRDMLKRILSKKLLTTMISPRSIQYATSNELQARDNAMKEIMESISSNRPLNTRTVEKARANELAALVAAESKRPEPSRSVFSSNRAKYTPSTMAQYTPEMRNANVARATALSANASAEVKPAEVKPAEVNALSTSVASAPANTSITSFNAEAVKAVATNSKLIRITRANGIFHKEIVMPGSNPKSIDGESRLFRLTREGGTYKIEQVLPLTRNIPPLNRNPLYTGLTNTEFTYKGGRRTHNTKKRK